ncbi:hypothetical protein AAY473_021036 [Plecturocebus cupreus]
MEIRPSAVAHTCNPSTSEVGHGGGHLSSQLLRTLRQENHLNSGGGGCSEPRLHHCTPAWAIEEHELKPIFPTAVLEQKSANFFCEGPYTKSCKRELASLWTDMAFGLVIPGEGDQNALSLLTVILESLHEHTPGVTGLDRRMKLSSDEAEEVIPENPGLATLREERNEVGGFCSGKEELRGGPRQRQPEQLLGVMYEGNAKTTCSRCLQLSLGTVSAHLSLLYLRAPILLLCPHVLFMPTCAVGS